MQLFSLVLVLQQGDYIARLRSLLRQPVWTGSTIRYLLAFIFFCRYKLIGATVSCSGNVGVQKSKAHSCISSSHPNQQT